MQTGPLVGPGFVVPGRPPRSQLSPPDDHRKARPGGDSAKIETTGGDDLVCAVVTCQRASKITLPAVAVAVPQLRWFVRSVLREWGLLPLVEVVELVASEMVTNAVMTTDGGMADGQAVVQARLVCAEGRLFIDVWDADSRPPVRQAPEDDAESGRGLLIVESLSRRWGYRPGTHGGKVVWAEIEARLPVTSAGLPRRIPAPLHAHSLSGQSLPDVEVLRRVRDRLHTL